MAEYLLDCSGFCLLFPSLFLTFASLPVRHANCLLLPYMPASEAYPRMLSVWLIARCSLCFPLLRPLPQQVEVRLATIVPALYPVPVVHPNTGVSQRCSAFSTHIPELPLPAENDQPLLRSYKYKRYPDRSSKSRGSPLQSIARCSQSLLNIIQLPHGI